MKGFIVSILSGLLLLCWSPQADAATLHAIIAADTNCNIGTGVNIDVDLVRAEFKRIAKFTDLDLHETLFVGDRFHSALVFDFLKQLQVQSDDVVIYYHSSHGFRCENMEEVWPALDFGSKPALDFSDIIDVIKAKPQRFALVLADCCNNYIPNWAVPPFYRSLPVQIAPALAEIANYRELFLGHEGLVAAAASRPGQYAWVSMLWGGFFTTSFLNGLVTQCQQNWTKATWDEVLHDAWSTTIWMANHMDCPQEPIYEVAAVPIQE